MRQLIDFLNSFSFVEEAEVKQRLARSTFSISQSFLEIKNLICFQVSIKIGFCRLFFKHSLSLDDDE